MNFGDASLYVVGSTMGSDGVVWYGVLLEFEVRRRDAVFIGNVKQGRSIDLKRAREKNKREERHVLRCGEARRGRHDTCSRVEFDFRVFVRIVV